MEPDKIDYYAQEADRHIRKMLESIYLVTEMKSSLEALKHSKEDQYLAELRQVKEEVAAIREQLERLGLPRIDHYERQLKFINTQLIGELWPQAVDPSVISKSVESESARANDILDLIVTEYLKNLKFLDVGCGAGHVAIAAAQRDAQFTVGYDLRHDPKWPEETKQLLFTNNMELVEERGPYDVMLLYDVLDHSPVEPKELLTKLKSLLSPRGRIYIRNHPWSSRHGGHLYTQINKAYLHLVLDEVELTRIGGITSEFNRKIIRPLETYKAWFEDSGFTVKNETVITEPAEHFFLHPDNHHLRERVYKHWNGGDPLPHIEISFVDYLIEPDKSGHQIF